MQNLNEDFNQNKNKDASGENKTRLFIRNLNRSIINTELRVILTNKIIKSHLIYKFY